MDDQRAGLPRTTVVDFYEPQGDGIEMEFRLVYRGSLHAAPSGKGGRKREKHLIRKQIHKQLKELYRQHPYLSWQLDEPIAVRQGSWVIPAEAGRFSITRFTPLQHNLGGIVPESAKPWVEWVAENYKEFGYRFVPLVRQAYGATCALDILFLRREGPGDLVRGGGDIDNRIKVLFDALTKPTEGNQVEGFDVEKDEDPFFCLLENDKLISKISVTTDRLILPMDDAEKLNDVHLVIHVQTQAIDPSAPQAGWGLI